MRGDGHVLPVACALLCAAGLGAALGIRSLQRGSAAPPSATLVARHGTGGLRGQATWASGAKPAPAITTLRDQSGHRLSWGSLRGQTVAVEFFDSHCHQQCPLAGRALASAERSIPRSQRPVLVVVSVNPRDTPASARAAIRRWNLQGAAPWHWLMGSHTSLAPVWRAYRMAVLPTKTDINHTEALYLLDRHGDERSGYLYPYIPSRVAGDMRTLASAHD